MPIAEPALQRLRMSWEEYLELPERPRAEWVAGEVVVSPPVGPDHGFAAVSLAAELRRHLPDGVVFTEVGLRLPGDRLRAPDVMVTDRWPEGAWVVDPPVLVAEVLSPSTRSEDTVGKSAEYAAGGVGQYWILDPEQRWLEVLQADRGGWTPLLRLDDETPRGQVVVPGHGVVHLDLTTLLRPAP
ncbi:Uma2 family endonuclease [Nocardioides nanhaiensis]|uniref:Uma2 family endonuclease n=1 Tax=Nocardioides nanhaiensis TaxID=1476871 RepID=UPI0031EC58EA